MDMTTFDTETVPKEVIGTGRHLHRARLCMMPWPDTNHGLACSFRFGKLMVHPVVSCWSAACVYARAGESQMWIKEGVETTILKFGDKILDISVSFFCLPSCGVQAKDNESNETHAEWAHMRELARWRGGTRRLAQVPNTLSLEVKETDPGVKGNTASGGDKVGLASPCLLHAHPMSSRRESWAAHQRGLCVALREPFLSTPLPILEICILFPRALRSRGINAQLVADGHARPRPSLPPCQPSLP